MFSDAERSFLVETAHGRLSTIGADDWPQIHPVAFVHDTDSDTIEIVGPRLRDTDKYRNIRRDPRVTLTIDDPALPLSGTDDRPSGRGMIVRGLAKLAESEGYEIIRLHPVRVDEWNVGTVGHHSRFVP